VSLGNSVDALANARKKPEHPAQVYHDQLLREMLSAIANDQAYVEVREDGSVWFCQQFNGSLTEKRLDSIADKDAKQGGVKLAWEDARVRTAKKRPTK
jgi:hypothetical protein